MSNRSVERTLDITGVGASGDGLADGVFVPFTLPGERVVADVLESRGELKSVLDASVERVEPPCPHFGICGGCTSQHWAHAPYLAWKVEQIRVTLERERIETAFAPAFAAAPGSRRRLALHARRGEKGGVRLGYKERRSWSLVDVAVCPISDPRLVAAFPALRKVAASFLDHPKSAPTLHVTLTETGLDVDVTGVDKKSGGLSADARMRAAEAASAADLARLTLDGDMVYGARQPTVRLGRATVDLPAGGFLQAVAAAEDAVAAVAVEAVSGAAKVVDLFSGSGAFSFRLAEVTAVHAVDGSDPAIRALTRATGTARGLKPVTAEARDLFRRPLGQSDLRRYDGAVFDPPRAGALAQAAELAASKLPVVVGVSCNPVTFARDARLLIDGGFRLERVTPVDQFLWSPHIELVGVFRR